MAEICKFNLCRACNSLAGWQQFGQPVKLLYVHANACKNTEQALTIKKKGGKISTLVQCCKRGVADSAKSCFVSTALYHSTAISYLRSGIL